MSKTVSFQPKKVMGKKKNHWLRMLMMLLPCFLLITFYFIPASSFAQITFEKTFGGTDIDEGYSVQQTSDGGYIIAGYTNSFGGRDIYLIKTDSLGDTLWTKTYGGSGNDYGRSVQQTSDGGYVIAGYTESFGSGSMDIYLVRTDSLGNILWTRTFGGTSWDEGHSVKETKDGGYIVVGSTTSFGAGVYDVYLIKTNISGDTLWTKTYGDTGWDMGYSVQQTSDGGYVIVGFTGSSNPHQRDVYLIKTDSLGSNLWTRTYGGTSADHGYSVQQTRDGGYIIAGTTYSFGIGDGDFYLVKINSSGKPLWSRTYGGINWDRGSSVQQTRDGGYIIGGWTDSFGGMRNVYLVKTDSLGDTLWTRTYGGSGWGVGYSVQETSDGGYIIAGSASSFGAFWSDVYLIKIDIWGPVLLSAVADDGIIPFPGIDNDDYVLITFSEATNKPNIDASNINAILSLSGGHSWLDGFGAIGSAVWNASGNQLTIDMSTIVGPPSVAVGDTITPDSVTITDLSGNEAFISAVITGSFDPQTGIEEGSQVRLPIAFHLQQNHPNPFCSATLIRYVLPAAGTYGTNRAAITPVHSSEIPVHLVVYDISGRLVETLVDERQEPGFYQVQWEGKDHSCGVYFYRLQSRDFEVTRKMILLR
jgi:hypothetical protein